MQLEESFLRLIITLIISELSLAFFAWILGMSVDERQRVKQFVFKKIENLKN